MKRVLLLAAAFLVTGSVRNLDSVKSDDYQVKPKKVVVSEVPFGFPANFRDGLTRKMAECGVALSFFPAADAEAQLQIHQMGVEKETIRRPKYVEFIKMTRYEFVLVDPATHQNVWKSQGDFQGDEPKSDPIDEQQAADLRADGWADDVVGRMRRDKLIGECGKSVAIEPPTQAQPQLQPAAAAAAPSAPSAGGAAAAPAPAPGPVNAPMRFKVGDTVYNSKEEAEVGLRADAAREVNKLDVTPGQPHGGLLVVLPVPKEPVKPATALPNGPSPDMIMQVLAFSMMTSRISVDSSLDSLKKTGLFSPVEVIHADDVADDDFRGQPYKLYLPKETGAKWMLVRQGGGASALTVGPYGGSTQAALHKWLDAVTAALNGLGG